MSILGQLRFAPGGGSRVGSVHATSWSIVRIGRGGGRHVGVLPLARTGGMAHGRRRRRVQHRVLVVGPPSRRCGSLLVVVSGVRGMAGLQGPSGPGIAVT